MRSDESTPDIAVQKREPAKSNFTILGVDLSDDDPLEKATAKLGKAQLVVRGDASTGRHQICYVSANDRPTVHLIFERGEVSDSFYLFAGGPDWGGSNACAKSKLLKENVSVASGIHLGQSPADVKAILGKPSVVAGDKVIYSFAVEKATPEKDFDRLRKEHPELNEDALRSNYGFYSLAVYVEARFKQSKLTYLAVLKTETY